MFYNCIGCKNPFNAGKHLAFFAVVEFCVGHFAGKIRDLSASKPNVVGRKKVIRICQACLPDFAFELQRKNQCRWTKITLLKGE